MCTNTYYFEKDLTTHIEKVRHSFALFARVYKTRVLCVRACV
jgi:hypothetical protein